MKYYYKGQNYELVKPTAEDSNTPCSNCALREPCNIDKFTKFNCEGGGYFKLITSSIQQITPKDNLQFEAIHYEGNDTTDFFKTLKEFCQDHCTISYEYATGIDFYWLIKVYDTIKDNYIVLTSGTWIIKISEGQFICLSDELFNVLFNKK